MQVAVAAKKAAEERDKLTKEPDEVETKIPVAAPEPPPLQRDAAEEEEEVEEQEVISPGHLNVTAPSARAKEQSLKSKQAKKLKAAAKAHGRPALSQGSCGASSKASSVGDAASTSGKSSAMTSNSPQALQDAWEKYSSQLNIFSSLSGESLGHLATNAQRALGPLKRANPGAAEVLLLQAHIDLFKRSEKVKPSNIQKCPAPERTSILQALMEDGTKFPAISQASILAVCIRDETDAEKVLQMMVPPAMVAEKESFNALHPRLSTCNLDEPAIVKAIARVLVEWIVPQVLGGKKSHMNVEQFVAKFGEVFHPDKVAKASPLVSGAIAEVASAVAGLKALLEDDGSDHGRSAFDVMFGAKKGPLLVLKQAPTCRKLTRSHTMHSSPEIVLWRSSLTLRCYRWDKIVSVSVCFSLPVVGW